MNETATLQNTESSVRFAPQWEHLITRFGTERIRRLERKITQAPGTLPMPFRVCAILVRPNSNFGALLVG